MAYQSGCVKGNFREGYSHDITPATELLSGTGVLAKDLAAEILAGEVNDARVVLDRCGCTAFIPGTNYGTLHTIADYYHVTRQYVMGIFMKYHITNRCSDAVLRVYPGRFLSQHGSGKCEYKCYDQTFEWMSESGQKMSVSARGQYYDARAILAFACLAVQNRRISTASVASQVMNSIETSWYMQAVIAKRKNEDPEPAKALAECEAGNATTSTISVSVSNGGISMNHSDFMKLMQAIHVNITGKPDGVKKEKGDAVSAETENTETVVERRCANANYAKMVRLYENGEISGIQAAKLLGITPGTFYGIAKKFGVQKRKMREAITVMV